MQLAVLLLRVRVALERGQDGRRNSVIEKLAKPAVPVSAQPAECGAADTMVANAALQRDRQLFIALLAGDQAARRMMAGVWRNYFDPPESAPTPSREWLAGVHSRPIFATRQAALAAPARELLGLPSVPVLIIFGENDIYGSTTERLVARYPNARVVIIPRAGHVPWLQNRAAFVHAISTFFEAEETA